MRTLLAAAETSNAADALKATPDTSADHAETPGKRRSAAHMLETLYALAIDLDRTLEEAPPKDLLQRYEQGEREVFVQHVSRHLDRLKPEDITAKYLEDTEFQQYVDRYVAQFEALTEDLSGRNPTVHMDSYFFTDTGKLYLRLAQASGHLSRG